MMLLVLLQILRTSKQTKDSQIVHLPNSFYFQPYSLPKKNYFQLYILSPVGMLHSHYFLYSFYIQRHSSMNLSCILLFETNFMKGGHELSIFIKLKISKRMKVNQQSASLQSLQEIILMQLQKIIIFQKRKIFYIKIIKFFKIIEQIRIENLDKMNMSQSKLMLQLNKEQKINEKTCFNQQKIQQLYNTISKLQPKNLMLVQFLTLVIQKNLIKNSFKIQTLVDLYEQIKGKKLEQEHNSFSLLNKSPNTTTYSNNGNNNTLTNNNNSTGSMSLNSTNNQPNSNTQTLEKQQQKFNKKKFFKLLKDIAKLLYPGDPKAFEVTLYLKLVMPEQQENRMKVDDNLKRFLNEDVIYSLAHYQKEFETLFQVYMPENYNLGLGFEWNQIRLLQKKLPIMCLLKILFQSQICPQFISQIQFLQIISKMIPPLNSNHKEVMFYYSQNFNNYMREHIMNDQIKLLEGDVGLTFLQFQFVMMRIATEISKQNKQQYQKYLDKLMNIIHIGQILKNKRELPKMTRIQTIVLDYIVQRQKQKQKNDQNSSSQNNSSKKPVFKKQYLLKKEHPQLNGLIDEQEPNINLKTLKNLKFDQQTFKRLEHESMLVTKDDLMKIKRNLDDQLGPVPEKVVIQKQNQGYFNVNQKFVVIGEQLPKIQQKNKPAPKANPKDKKEDPLLGYLPQPQPKDPIQHKPSQLLNRKKKLRINNQYPIILTQVFYPDSFTDPSILQLKEQQQIYLETTYIHLGQRMYQQAYTNFQKSKSLAKDNKKPFIAQTSPADKRNALVMEFYFQVLQAQIFQAAGKDQAALMHYYNARELSFNLPATQVRAKAFTLLGLSAGLYHLEQYQFSLRCLLKAKQIYGQSLQVQSIDNAILLNNIGSCYMMLNRNQQAVKYFNLSHQIFDLKAGRFDERSLVVQQNISKNKKAYMQQMPSFKTMWKTYVQKSSNVNASKAVKKTKK